MIYCIILFVPIMIQILALGKHSSRYPFGSGLAKKSLHSLLTNEIKMRSLFYMTQPPAPECSPMGRYLVARNLDPYSPVLYPFKFVRRSKSLAREVLGTYSTLGMAYLSVTDSGLAASVSVSVGAPARVGIMPYVYVRMYVYIHAASSSAATTNSSCHPPYPPRGRWWPLECWHQGHIPPSLPLWRALYSRAIGFQAWPLRHPDARRAHHPYPSCSP